MKKPVTFPLNYRRQFSGESATLPFKIYFTFTVTVYLSPAVKPL